jgi:hypothetical protein
MLEGATGMRYDGVVYREVCDEDGPTRLNFMAYWREANESPTLGQFLAMLRERYPDLSVEPGGARRMNHDSPRGNPLGSISKCGDARLRTLLYKPANVMLTRYRGNLALKTWALDIARRSTMRKARVALARRLAVIMFAMLKHGAEFEPA